MNRFSFIIIFLLFGQIIRCQNWLGFGGLIPDNGYVQSLYYSSNTNKLYIGGDYNTVLNGKVMRNIASFDGVNFDTLGGGVTGSGRVMEMTDYNGKLYIVGLIDSTGYKKTWGVSKWDGVKWDSLGPQLNGSASTLEIYNNELYIGGYFWKAGTLNVRSVVKYDGANWSNPGFNGFPYTTVTGVPYINCMEVYNNELYVGGDFYDSTSNHICCAKFDGTAWRKTGLIINGGITEVLDLKVYNGNLYLAGRFKANEGNVGNAILKYNGSTWTNVGEAVTDPGTCLITKMKVINNKLWVVGGFKSIENTLSAGGVAIWNDTSWCVPPTGPQVYKCSSLEYFQNKTYLGGSFDSIGVEQIHNLAVLNTTVTVCSAPVSVAENENNSGSIEIYPNPTNGKVFISSETFDLKNTQIKIINQLGQTIMQENSNEIDLTFLAKGLYYIEIKNKSSQNIFKILKE